MLDSLFEIVVLADGDVILKRAEENGDPLVRIRFSEEALSYIEGMRVEVAKAMIDAAIETVEHSGFVSEEMEESETTPESLVLH